ncbi:hypothetical protein CZ787_02215 [Halomonas citrativorans]|uniref:Uncharacterized protein n=1 Tax=Halomonas citrativorans TaxID=2742612 RepID=A0A1R4HQF3_9GAMM|nr:hypothetical protein CZ787_02215 [Halomonas citrativorans]
MVFEKLRLKKSTEGFLQFSLIRYIERIEHCRLKTHRGNYRRTLSPCAVFLFTLLPLETINGTLNLNHD